MKNIQFSLTYGIKYMYYLNLINKEVWKQKPKLITTQTT